MIKSRPTCKICGGRVRFKRGRGYATYCSKKCEGLDISPFKNNDVQKKAKQTKIERYGDVNYNNREKCKETCLEKYGVASVFLSDEVNEKRKQTMINKYGVEYSAQNPELLKRQQETQRKLYGGPWHPKKTQETMEQLYGTKFFTQTDQMVKINKEKQEERQKK